MNIAFSSLTDLQKLPINARGLANYIQLVIAGDIAGDLEPAITYTKAPNFSVDYEVEYLPNPVTFSLRFGSGRYGLSIPYEGTNGFYSPQAIPSYGTSGGFASNFGGVGNEKDGDPDTFIEAGVGASSFEYQYPEGDTHAQYVRGFYLAYGLKANAGHETYAETNTPAMALIRYSDGSPGDDYLCYAMYALLPTAEADAVEIPIKRVRCVLPLDARFHPDNQGPTFRPQISVRIQAKGMAVANEFVASSFYPLYVNDAALLKACFKKLRLASNSPKRVTVPGFIPPEPTHTVTGYPGGDYVGTVETQTYSGGYTTINFEEAGGTELDAARALENRLDKRIERESIYRKLARRY